MTSSDLDPANPFARPSTLPFGLPDYAAIHEEHYGPALLAGMAEQRAQVNRIAADPAPATVENTLVPLERSGRLLARAAAAFFNQVGSDATPGLEAVEAEIAPRLAAHHDAVYLDARLHARLEAIAADVDSGGVTLEPDTAWLLHTYRTDFARSGIALPEADQARLRELNGEITSLETAFGRVLLAATNAAAVLVEDVGRLAGLAPDAVAAAREAAARSGYPSGYLLELVLPTQQPVLASLVDRDLRERVHRASVTRGTSGEHDTRATLLRLVRLRAERARLLGYDHHAAYVAQDACARTTAAVDSLLGRLAPAAVANARAEAADLQAALEADLPGARLEPWDWAYYAERVRTQRYAVDDARLRPYLELDRVLRDGVFRSAGRLYGLTFTERPDLVGHHPDVRVWEVADERADQPIGLFLGDFHARPSKRGGAWMNALVDQSTLLGDRPVVVNTLNIAKPPAGEPTLLAWDEVITLFHEFGHALHGLLSQVRYPSQSGTEVPRDFVEYPSQVNEMWAWEPEILRCYAVHHVTGEPVPQQWVDTMLASRQFNEGFATTEYLAAALLDQAWYQLAPEAVPTDPDEVEAFEAAALERAGVAVAAVPPRYRSPYFNHVFGGGYSAAYYSYIWSEVLDADTVEWFAGRGGLSRANGDEFRDRLLRRGGSVEAMQAFRDLRGRDPEIAPLLARRGLLAATTG